MATVINDIFPREFPTSERCYLASQKRLLVGALNFGIPGIESGIQQNEFLYKATFVGLKAFPDKVEIKLTWYQGFLVLMGFHGINIKATEFNA